MATMYTPNAERLVALGFESVARVPVLFDRQQRYCREHNRYLRERDLGEWTPKAARDSITKGEALAQRSIETIARHLGVFIDWCDANKRDWRTVTYVNGVLAFQNDMAKGRWSPSGAPVAGTTANHRADEVTSFLIWAAQKNLRPAFKVQYRTSQHQILSGQSSKNNWALARSRIGRIKTSKTTSINQVALLPTAAEIRDWLTAVRARRGYAKYLACRFILETGTRREETIRITEDQIPTADELDWLKRQGKLGAGIALTHTKGGRPRTIQVNIGFLTELREWIDGRRLRLKMLWTKRMHTPSSRRLFLSDARDHEGTPISAETLYKCFYGVNPRPRKWHPHFGRHAYACFTILYILENDAKIMGRTLGADWVAMRASWGLKTLQHQLGHLSEATTDLYLRWLVTAAGIPEVTQSWHDFLSGEVVAGPIL